MRFLSIAAVVLLAAIARADNTNTNRQLLPIRQLELFRDRRKVEGDEKLSADEKAKLVAEIDRKLAALK